MNNKKSAKKLDRIYSCTSCGIRFTKLTPDSPNICSICRLDEASDTYYNDFHADIRQLMNPTGKTPTFIRDLNDEYKEES